MFTAGASLTAEDASSYLRPPLDHTKPTETPGIFSLTDPLHERQAHPLNETPQDVNDSPVPFSLGTRRVSCDVTAKLIFMPCADPAEAVPVKPSTLVVVEDAMVEDRLGRWQDAGKTGAVAFWERRHRRVLKGTRPGVVRNGDNEGGLARGRLVSKLGKRWRSAGVVLCVDG